MLKRVSRPGARWPACVLLATLSLAATRLPGALAALQWQRAALDDGQWQRLLTAHLVHLDTHHLLFNLLGLLLIAELLLARWRGREIFSLMLFSALGTSLLLWCCEPRLQWYAGLSGLLQGLWAGAALAGWLRSRRHLYAGALVLLAIKLIWLNPGSTALGIAPAVPVVPVAHWYGAVSGLAWAGLRHAWRRLRHFD